MVDLWLTLVPLIVAGAIMPLPLVLTLLLLQAPNGLRTAGAWVGGMTAVRLGQGIAFGVVFAAGASATETETGRAAITSMVLVVVALLFYVMAGKQLLNEPDPDAPPPRWRTAAERVGPGRAFLLGAGLMLIGVKFWVFTLSAIAAIREAQLGVAGGTATFLAFVLLTESIHIGAVMLALAAPGRAQPRFSAAVAWLEAKNRPVLIALGLVLGTWFLLRGLDGLGAWE
jgi:hypothetical protein